MKKFILIFILISSLVVKAQFPPNLLLPYQSPTSFNTKLDSTYVPGKTYRVDNYTYSSTTLNLELTGHYIVETDNYLLKQYTLFNDNVVYNSTYDKYVYTYFYQQNKLTAKSTFLKKVDSIQIPLYEVDSFNYNNASLNNIDRWNNSNNQLNKSYGTLYNYDSLQRFTGTDGYNLDTQYNMVYTGYYKTDSFTIYNLPAKVSTFAIKDTLKISSNYYLYFYDSLLRPTCILNYQNPFGTYLLSDSSVYYYTFNKVYPDSILHFSNQVLNNKKVLTYSSKSAISEIDNYSKANGVFMISSKEVYSTNLNTGLQNINSIDNNISIYPNPTTDKLFIQSPKEKVLSYKIIDMQGKILADEKLISESISLNGISNGILVVQLNLSDGTIISKRVLKIE